MPRQLMPPQGQIGIALQNAMDAAGLRQAELARQSGIGRDSLSLYIRGRQTPTRATMARIARALGVDVDSLMPGASDDDQGQAVRVRELNGGMARLTIDADLPIGTVTHILGLIEAAK